MKNFALRLYKSLFSYEFRLWLYKLRHLQAYRDKRSVVHPSEKGDFSLKPFDEYRCLFIHITKTAGTAVATSLFGYLPYHYTAIDYRVIYGRKDFDDYFKFAYVRNPWDRLYSAWRYLRKGGWNEDDRNWYADHLAQYDDFDSFVRLWLRPENLTSHRHFWPQHVFLCDRKQNIIIDYLAYFETIDDDFNYLSKRIGIDASLTPQNTNPGEHYTSVYNDETRQIVADVYAQDIELFGYQFEGVRDRRVLPGG